MSITNAIHQFINLELKAKYHSVFSIHRCFFDKLKGINDTDEKYTDNIRVERN